MRVVIELKRGEVAEVVLNCLYKQTQLQDTFGMNMVALVDGQPRLLNLKQMLECFLWHRREVLPGAPSSSCARRASGRTSRKAWRWRSTMSMRSSR
jgi:DNA gyrase/topoisomerase IV subunit A